MQEVLSLNPAGVAEVGRVFEKVERRLEETKGKEFPYHRVNV